MDFKWRGNRKSIFGGRIWIFLVVFSLQWYAVLGFHFFLEDVLKQGIEYKFKIQTEGLRYLCDADNPHHTLDRYIHPRYEEASFDFRYGFKNQKNALKMDSLFERKIHVSLDTNFFGFARVSSIQVRQDKEHPIPARVFRSDSLSHNVNRLWLYYSDFIGRFQLKKSILQGVLPKNKEQCISVLETGDFHAMINIKDGYAVLKGIRVFGTFIGREQLLD